VELPQTTQHFAAGIRSGSADFFAASRISGEMTGSAITFFFMLDFTIVYTESQQNSFGLPEAKSTDPVPLPFLYPIYLTRNFLLRLRKTLNCRQRFVPAPRVITHI
jgi:hypothetical protein